MKALTKLYYSIIMLILLSSIAFAAKQNISITPIIDGQLGGFFSCSRNDDMAIEDIIRTSGFSETRRLFYSWNTSNISSSNITGLWLTVNRTSFNDWDSNDKAIIVRLNGTRVNSTDPNNDPGVCLFNDAVDNATMNYSVTSGINAKGLLNISLGSQANLDFMNQSGQDGYFTIVMRSDEIDTDHSLSFSMMEGTYPPNLTVEYDPCAPPVSTDWVINTTCIVYNQTLLIPKDIRIYQSGKLYLNMTILNFTSVNQAIEVYSGGFMSMQNNSYLIG